MTKEEAKAKLENSIRLKMINSTMPGVMTQALIELALEGFEIGWEEGSSRAWKNGYREGWAEAYKQI